MTKLKTKMEWTAENNRLLMAGKNADAIVEGLNLAIPIDPLAIVNSENPLLRAGGGDFGNRYDGKLEYHSAKNRFLLFYNTKYDRGLPSGVHHSRTRFSICHELGHYFLEKHHEYLMRTRQSHQSKGEFYSDNVVEKEADSFAASILLPTKFARPIINSGELSISRINDIAEKFKASLVCTTFRSVAISDFPCAVAGIRDGQVIWMFPSDGLVRAGIYPNKGFLPSNALKPWTEFQMGVGTRSQNEGRVQDWFNTYGNDDLKRLYVTEEYLPVPTMGTLLVLLTMDESDVFPEEEEEEEEEEERGD